jgi:hypothetical protein
MPNLIISNINVIVEAFKQSGSKRHRQDTPHCHAAPPSQRAVLRRVHAARKKLRQIACSSTWAEDCLHRGAAYSPDLKCQCPNCREKFPNRLHPRPVQETNISSDCQQETEADPDLAEELKALRNDRPRLGSVFLDARIKLKKRPRKRAAKKS